MADINWWAVSPLLLFVWMCLNSAVKAYRIRMGKKQMNDWLKCVGENFDKNWDHSEHYSRDAIKKHLAKLSAAYFAEVRKGERW